MRVPLPIVLAAALPLAVVAAMVDSTNPPSVVARDATTRDVRLRLALRQGAGRSDSERSGQQQQSVFHGCTLNDPNCPTAMCGGAMCFASVCWWNG